MSDRPETAEYKKRQISGGDWYKMDDNIKAEEPPAQSTKFELDLSSLRTTTPLPGLRDSDVDSAALPSARHAMKDEYSDYVKLAKQGGHQGLLKIEGNSNAGQTGDKKMKIHENDSEYVKIAKVGGHSDLLKMNGANEEAPKQKSVFKESDSEYVKMAKAGGHSDLIKTEGVQVAESPRRNYIKETDSDYVKLAKTGGHQGLLDANAKPVDTGANRYAVKESDSEYIRLAKTGGHANLLASESTSPRPTSANSRRNMVSESDTAYVKLAKQGGDANLLKMENAKPALRKAPYKSTSSEWFQHDEKRSPDVIATGKGKGLRKENNNNNSSRSVLPSSDEQAGKTGKKFFHASGSRDAPFALHY